MSVATNLTACFIFGFLSSVSIIRAQLPLEGANPSPAPATPPAALPVGRGHIQFVNATAREGGLIISVNKEVLSSSGFASGQYTGPMRIRERPLKILGSLPPFKDTELDLVVKPDHLHLIIATIEIEEKKDKPPVEKLVFKLQEFPPGKATSPSVLLVLQMTNVPVLNIRFGGLDLVLNHGEPQIVNVTKAMGMFPQAVFRNTAVETFNYHEPDSKCLILFTDKAGGLRTASFGTVLN
jgi:hypothetical protein